MEYLPWVIIEEENTNRMSRYWSLEVYIELKIKLNFENHRSTTV